MWGDVASHAVQSGVIIRRSHAVPRAHHSLKTKEGAFVYKCTSFTLRLRVYHVVFEYKVTQLRICHTVCFYVANESSPELQLNHECCICRTCVFTAH